MKWRRGTGRSGDVIDRRGQGGFGGGGLPIPIGVGGGLGGIGLLIFLVIVLLSGGLPGGGEGAPLDPLNPVEQPAPGSATGPDPDANLRQFVGFLATDVQNQ